jgi:hypothetical protein
MVTLAHDYHPDVRCAIANNPSAQRSVLAYLAADRHVEVVRAVVENPSLPSDILDELSLHKKATIREAAAQRLNELTAEGRRESNEQSVSEDSRVPEMAEHVLPGYLAGDAQRVARSQAPEHGDGHSQDPADARSPAPVSTPQAADVVGSTGEEESAPRWTRTAPVRGFRLPG